MDPGLGRRRRGAPGTGWRRGLLDGEGGPTAEGRDLRERIERTTDRGARVVLDRLGDGDGELFGLLEPISRAMVGPDGHPSSPATMLR